MTKSRLRKFPLLSCMFIAVVLGLIGLAFLSMPSRIERIIMDRGELFSVVGSQDVEQIVDKLESLCPQFSDRFEQDGFEVRHEFKCDQLNIDVTKQVGVKQELHFNIRLEKSSQLCLFVGSNPVLKVETATFFDGDARKYLIRLEQLSDQMKDWWVVNLESCQEFFRRGWHLEAPPLDE